MAAACHAAGRLVPAAAAAAAARHLRLPALCRAAATKAAKAAEPASFSFDPAAPEAPLFPELLQPGRRAVLVAVDPDLSGAVAALSWHNPPATGSATASGSSSGSSPSSSSSISSSGSGGGGGGDGSIAALPSLGSVRVEVYDMPVEVWLNGKRNKKQPQASGLIQILQACTGVADSGSSGGTGTAAELGGAMGILPEAKKRRRRAGSGTPEASAAAAAGAVAAVASPSEASAAAAAAGGPQQGAAGAQAQAAEEPPLVRAIVEYSMPAQLSGKYAWYGIGFSVGLLNGLLTAQGIHFHRVHAATWKAQMGLRRVGKEGSIALARHLLPGAAGLLTRKKDHGRAEALLMAAWAMGVRMQPIETSDSAAAAGEAESAEEDSD